MYFTPYFRLCLFPLLIITLVGADISTVERIRVSKSGNLFKNVKYHNIPISYWFKTEDCLVKFITLRIVFTGKYCFANHFLNQFSNKFCNYNAFLARLMLHCRVDGAAQLKRCCAYETSTN